MLSETRDTHFFASDGCHCDPTLWTYYHYSIGYYSTFLPACVNIFTSYFLLGLYRSDLAMIRYTTLELSVAVP